LITLNDFSQIVVSAGSDSLLMCSKHAATPNHVSSTDRAVTKRYVNILLCFLVPVWHGPAYKNNADIVWLMLQLLDVLTILTRQALVQHYAMQLFIY